MILTWILLIIGFVMITSGATWLTNGSAAIAQRLKMSEYIIGMTIVAVGTSLPELTVSVASTFAGSADMAIGNVVGSNIFNILFILGICALIKPVSFTKNNLRVDIWLCLAVSLALVAMLWGGKLSRIEGIVMVLCYIAVIIFSIKSGNKEQGVQEDEPQESSKFSWIKSLLLVALGLLALVYGADLTLDSAITVARSLGISERVIGITLLAGGTSLPELAASLVAVSKGHGALALGNVIGSNIANILLILGSCATITPLAMGSITYIDLGVLFGAAVLLAISARVFGHRVITRMEAVAFLAAYVLYIWYLID
jgi:cation:H+ antiporter